MEVGRLDGMLVSEANALGIQDCLLRMAWAAVARTVAAAQVVICIACADASAAAAGPADQH